MQTSIMCVASGRPAPRMASVEHLVREHADDVGLDRRDVVDAAHHERAERRDRRREQHQVGAEVLRGSSCGSAVILPSRVAPILTYAIWSRPWCVASMPSERALDPLDRPLELARGPRERDLLAVDLQLGAEAAADLRRDRPHALLADPELSARNSRILVWKAVILPSRVAPTRT